MIKSLQKHVLAAIFLLAIGVLIMSDVLASSFSQSASHSRNGARPRAFTFVQLVFESRAIIVGTVIATSADSALPITLVVERSFPDGLPDRLQIVPPPPAMNYSVTFSKGERSVLFLAEVTGNQAVLLGTGDVGKWPRRQPDWLFTAGHVRPLSEVVTAIELLLKTDAAKTCEQRLAILLYEILPLGSIGQIATAQYTADYTRWENIQSSPEIDLSQVRWLVAAHLLPEAERRDPAVIYALLQLLSSAPSSIAIPHLITHLNAADAAERDTAFSALRTVANPFTQETFGYASANPAVQRTVAIGRWQEWWNTQRSARLRDEAPQMLADLKSTTSLRRAAGDLALRFVSNLDMGFNAQDSPSQREVAISRWSQWWTEYSHGWN